MIFAFDEIVALGYRENVNLAQIRTFTEMDSHEEKVFLAVRQVREIYFQILTTYSIIYVPVCFFYKAHSCQSPLGFGDVCYSFVKTLSVQCQTESVEKENLVGYTAIPNNCCYFT